MPDFTRTEPGTSLPMPKTAPTKAYDWTYTTTYPGHIVSNTPPEGTGSFVPADPENPEHKIPIAELTRPDPILFYAEIPLYEDELHDNGSSHVSVRIVGPPFDASTLRLLIYTPSYSVSCLNVFSSWQGLYSE